MTLPTKNWNAGTGTGTFDIWSGGVISAAAMVGDLVTKMLPLFNADISFDNFLVYKQLLPDDDPEPVASASFSGQVGTNVSASWAKAVELIFIARTTAFGIAKLSLLDAVSNNAFLPITSPSVDPQALIDEWFDDAKGWSGRDNFQPSTFLKFTTNINQKLRKAYRLD